MQNLMDQFRFLGIRSPIQKKAVEILYGLQGYSKRVDLLEDQLRKELGRDGIGPSRIHLQLSELIELGLAERRHATGGPRFALNKDIWDLELPVIELVCTVTERLANGVRSDTKFSGVLKTVKTKIRKANAHPTELKRKAYEILVACALRRHPDWELFRGEVVRKGAELSGQVTSRQADLLALDNEESAFKNDKKQGEVQSEAKAGKATVANVISDSSSAAVGVELPENIVFELTDMENLLSQILNQEFDNNYVRFFGRIATIDVPLSLGRGQRIYVSLRRSATHEKVFWIFSVCGALSPVKSKLLSIISHNNDCHSFKVSLINLQAEAHICVCISLETNGNWEKQLPTSVRNLAIFSDHLEENYWRLDNF